MTARPNESRVFKYTEHDRNILIAAHAAAPSKLAVYLLVHGHEELTRMCALQRDLIAGGVCMTANAPSILDINTEDFDDDFSDFDWGKLSDATKHRSKFAASSKKFFIHRSAMEAKCKNFLEMWEGFGSRTIDIEGTTRAGLEYDENVLDDEELSIKKVPQSKTVKRLTFGSPTKINLPYLKEVLPVLKGIDDFLTSIRGVPRMPLKDFITGVEELRGALLERPAWREASDILRIVAGKPEQEEIKPVLDFDDGDLD